MPPSLWIFCSSNVNWSKAPCLTIRVALQHYFHEIPHNLKSILFNFAINLYCILHFTAGCCKRVTNLDIDVKYADVKQPVEGGKFYSC